MDTMPSRISCLVAKLPIPSHALARLQHFSLCPERDADRQSGQAPVPAFENALQDEFIMPNYTIVFRPEFSLGEASLPCADKI